MDERRTKDAFEDFHVREFAGVLRLVTGVAGRAEAWDLTQEAFVRTWDRWESLKEADAPLKFTRAVAVNLSRSWLRRVYRMRARLHLLLDPRERMSDDQVDPDVWLTLEQLPRRQREAVVLCDVIGMTAKDAAEILRSNAGTTRVHLSRGRTRVRQSLTTGARDASDASPRGKARIVRAGGSNEQERSSLLS